MTNTQLAEVSCTLSPDPHCLALGLFLGLEETFRTLQPSCLPMNTFRGPKTIQLGILPPSNPFVARPTQDTAYRGKSVAHGPWSSTVYLWAHSLVLSTLVWPQEPTTTLWRPAETQELLTWNSAPPIRCQWGLVESQPAELDTLTCIV